MPTLTGNDLVARARVTLLDPTPGKTWTDALFLILINSMLRKLALVKNDIYAVTGSVSLVAGVEQALPEGGVLVMKGQRNVTSGKPVAIVSEQLLREEQRWSQPATQETDVREYCVDPRDPTRFLVNPPNNGTGALRMLYGSTPAIASLATVIPIPDIYETPLHYLLVAEAYQADTERKDLSKTQTYETRAMQLLGVNTETKAVNTATLGKPGAG